MASGAIMCVGYSNTCDPIAMKRLLGRLSGGCAVVCVAMPLLAVVLSPEMAGLRELCRRDRRRLCVLCAACDGCVS